MALLTSPIFGHAGVLSTSGTRYYPIAAGIDHAATTNETDARCVMAGAGTLQNLRVKVTVAPGAGKDWTFTVMKNGSATGIVLTVADAATSGADTTNTVSYADGDTISLRAVPTGTPAASSSPAWGIEALSTDGQPLTSTSDPTSTTVDCFMALQGSKASSTATIGAPIPTAGTIRGLRIALQFSAGTGDSWTITLVKNGVDTSLTATVSGNSATTGSDLVNTVSVAPGDVVYWRIDPTGTPASGAIKIGARFVPDTSGESVQLNGSNSTLTTGSGSQFNGVTGGSNMSYSGTEINRANVLPGAFDIKKFRGVLAVAPSAGKSRAFTVRAALANTTSTFTIADTATTGDDSAHEPSVTAGDYLAVNIVGTGTPVASAAQWSFVTYRAPPVSQDISPSGIASAEAFGTPMVGLHVAPSGAASSEAFGTAVVTTGPVTITMTGIASAEALGMPVVGSVTIRPTGIASSEAFGAPTLTLWIAPTGIASAGAFGAATITVPAVSIAPLGIGSGATVGFPTLTTLTTIAPSGIASAALFGTLRLAAPAPGAPYDPPRNVLIYQGTEYEWPINHSTEDTMSLGHTAQHSAPNPAVTVVRQQSAAGPLLYRLQGTILDPAQRTALQAFFDDCESATSTEPVVFRHADGDEYEVVLTSLDMPAEKVGVNPQFPALYHVWRPKLEMLIVHVRAGALEEL